MISSKMGIILLGVYKKIQQLQKCEKQDFRKDFQNEAPFKKKKKKNAEKL